MSNTNAPTMAIILEGGNITNVIGITPGRVILVDYDTFGVDERSPNLLEVEQDDGTLEDALIGTLPIEVNPREIKGLHALAVRAEGIPGARADHGQPVWPPVLPFEQAFTNVLDLVVEEFHRRLLDQDHFDTEHDFSEELRVALLTALRILTGRDDASDDLLLGLRGLARDKGIAWNPRGHIE